MDKQQMSTQAALRSQLMARLAGQLQGSALEQRIDIEMRLMMAHYDSLQQWRVQVSEELFKPDRHSDGQSPVDYILKRIHTGEQAIRAKLEFAGDLLSIEQMVIAACLSTIALHHAAHGESTFEHAYPLLRDYFAGENSLLFPHLGFFTKKEILRLLDLEEDGLEEA